MDTEEFDAKLKPIPAEDAVELTPEQLAENKVNKEATAKAYQEFEQFKDNKDVDGLITVLKNTKHQYLAKQAIWALGEIGNEKALAPLMEEVLKRNHGMSAGEYAVKALGDIGNQSVVEPLIYLMGKHDYLRKAAAEALGKLKNVRAVKPLKMLMNDENEDQYARETALEALCKIGTQESIAAVIAVLGGNLGEKAFFALKELGEVAIQPLISALNSENQLKAVKLLGEMGGKQAINPLLAIIEKYNTQNFDVIRAVVQAIMKINDTDTITKVVEMLINILKTNPLPDEDYAAKLNLIFALGDTQDRRAIKPLVRLLLIDGDDAVRIRYRSAWALATMGSKIDDPIVIQQLIGVLGKDRKDKQPHINMIAWALLQTDEKKTAIPVLKYLKDNHMETLRKALFPEYEIAM